MPFHIIPHHIIQYQTTPYRTNNTQHHTIPTPYHVISYILNFSLTKCYLYDIDSHQDIDWLVARQLTEGTNNGISLDVLRQRTLPNFQRSLKINIHCYIFHSADLCLSPKTAVLQDWSPDLRLCRVLARISKVAVQNNFVGVVTNFCGRGVLFVEPFYF